MARLISLPHSFLKNRSDTYGPPCIYLFPGIGNEETDAIGFDLALMASSDHTIISRGSFSTWCAILCGGEYYGEYGPIISLTNLINQQDKNHKSKKNSKKRKIY